MAIYSEKLGKINFSHITEKVQHNTGMDAKTALEAAELYKQYLAIKAKHPETIISPPTLADHMWHEHILSTRQYMDDCNELFGEYLHHQSDLPEESLTEAWNNSLHLYKKEFGVDLAKTGHTAGRCCA